MKHRIAVWPPWDFSLRVAGLVGSPHQRRTYAAFGLMFELLRRKPNPGSPAQV